MHRLPFGLLLSFHRHSCLSIMIIYLHSAANMRCERAQMARQVYLIFLSNWDGAPLGVGVLRKLHTLHVGSGTTVGNAGKISFTDLLHAMLCSHMC